MSDLSDQSDHENIRTCPHCQTEYKDGVGYNEVNFKRHVNSCELKQSKKNPKRMPGQQSILTMFKKCKTSKQGDDIVSNYVGDNINIGGNEQDPSCSKDNTSVYGAATETGADQQGAVIDINAELHDTGVNRTEVSASDISLFSDKSVNTLEIPKCKGYIPVITGDIYEYFPFHVVKKLNVVFECGVFHTQGCMNNGYRLFDNVVGPVNECCDNLRCHEKLSKIVNQANDTELHLSTVNHEVLSYGQLIKRTRQMSKNLSNEKMKSLNKARKLKHLNKSLDLHQRFMMLIRENSIPKLHQIVKVALSGKKSISYIINKIVDAVKGLYNPHSSEEDKDLSFLILQYGGPGLLDIVHRALNFPSTSTAYRLLQSTKKAIVSSIDTPLNKFVENIVIDPDSPKYGYMLKIDETYIDAKVRWNPHDNKVYGICYEHGRVENLLFSDYHHVEQLADMVKSGTLHVPKETMAIACSSNSLNSKAQFVVALPTCSKDEIEYQANLIDNISSNFAQKNGAPFLNWSTDGDPSRRQIFTSLCSYSLSNSSPIYPMISKMKLIDTLVGRNEETTNYDAKHLAKRIRTCLIGDNFHLGENMVLLKSDLEKVLQCVPNETNHSTNELLNPNDKQNVGLSTQLLIQFCKSVEDFSEIENIGFRFSDIAPELHLVKYVIEGILITYTKPDASIKEQLEIISLGAHILFILQRTLKTFLPNQLYHDIQATFEDTFYCAVKWKIYHSNEPLYLMLCSNDVLERLFGNLRLKYRHCSIDNLELLYATRSMQLCTDMMQKHPDWFSKNRSTMQRLCLDYSNPSVWNRDSLILQNVNIVSAWNTGRAKAEQILNKFKKYEGDTSDFYTIASEGYTLLVPYGSKQIGLNRIEIDYSLDDISVNDDAENEDENSDEDEDSVSSVSSSIIDMIDHRHKHDPQIEIENSYVYKATVVKGLFSSNQLSKDRLRRVRGLSKNVDSENIGENVSFDSSVMPGDPILVMANGELQICQIKCIRKASKKMKIINVEEMKNDNVSFEVIIMKMKSYRESYIWTNDFIGNSFITAGSNVYAVQPSLTDIEGKLIYTFDKQFILELNLGNASVAIDQSEQDHSESSAGGRQQSNYEELATTSKGGSHTVDCFVCQKKISFISMRQHVGRHILDKTVSGTNVCGFCGQDACENILIKTSSKRSKIYFKVQSNCSFFVEWKKTPLFSTRNYCSNHLIICEICKSSIWTYNGTSHYIERHPDVECPTFITDIEIKKMKSKVK